MKTVVRGLMSLMVLSAVVMAVILIIDIDLLAKANSSAPNGNFSHQLVANDLDEDKCYWENTTALVVTKCTDPMPSNAEVIALVEYGGTPENYTVWADTAESDNTYCDSYVVDGNGAKRQIPIGIENNITLCKNCMENFSIYGYVVFKDLDAVKDDNCRIVLVTDP